MVCHMKNWYPEKGWPSCLRQALESKPGLTLRFTTNHAHLFQNFLQFIVIHTVKDFGIVNKAEIDVFLELSCFFHDPVNVGNLISGSSAKLLIARFRLKLKKVRKTTR